MPAWITIYCARPVGHVSAPDLSIALEAADLHTRAEGFGIDDGSVVEEALAQLKIESATGSDGTRFQVTYAGPNQRPLLIHVWDDAARVRTEQEEALEDINDPRVRTAVQQAVQVVGIELGWSQLEDMGVVLGVQLAEAFASAGRGMLRDQNDDWWAIEDGVTTRVFRPDGHA